MNITKHYKEFIDFINSSDRNVTAIALNDDNYKFLIDEMIYNSFSRLIKVNGRKTIYNLKQEELKYLGFDFNFNQDIYLNSSLNKEIDDYVANLLDKINNLIKNSDSKNKKEKMLRCKYTLEQLKFSEVEREFIVLITPQNEMIGFSEFSKDYLNFLAVRPKFQHLGYGKLLLDALKNTFSNLTLHTNDDYNYQFYLSQGAQIIEEDDDGIMMMKF